jgi:CRP/FNR family cyclic AMP-dependent transcriptional regulator
MNKETLRCVELLKTLSDSDLEKVYAVTTEHKAKKNGTILLADDPGKNVFFLIEGEAKVTMIGQDGKEFLLSIIEEGDFFGELSALTGEDRSANVIAMTDCKLVLIPNEDFLHLLSQMPSLSMCLLKSMALRLRASSFKLGEFALMDVTERVKQTLKSLAESEVVNGVSRLVVHKRPTHVMLASMVGTSREMVTRALSLLEETGELKFDGKTVVFDKL